MRGVVDRALVRRLLARAPAHELARASIAPLAAWARVASAGARPGHADLHPSVARWMLQGQAVSEVASVAREARVKIAFLKGADLNLCVYPQPGIRPMVDVDLLVDPADLDALARQLERRGFQHASAPEATAADAAFEDAFVRERDGVALDVHRAVDWQEGLAVSTTTLLGRVATCGPKSIPVLDAADRVLHLAVHALKDLRRERWRPIVDVGCALAASGLDWDALAQRAREWGARPALRMLLGRLKRFGGIDVPKPVLRRLEVGLLPRLTSRWLAGFVESPRGLGNVFLERAVRLMMVETWSRRWALARRYLALRLERGGRG